MHRFMVDYNTNGLSAMLMSVHIHCTLPLDDNEQQEISFDYIRGDLLAYVTRLCMRLKASEPVMDIIYKAYIDIEMASSVAYKSMGECLCHYRSIVDTYIPKLGPLVRNNDEFNRAYFIIMCFAHSTFESCHQYMNPLCLLAEDAILDGSGKPSLLNLYHDIWISSLRII